jgi:hypothetical protein
MHRDKQMLRIGQDAWHLQGTHIQGISLNWRGNMATNNDRTDFLHDEKKMFAANAGTNAVDYTIY